MCTALAALHKRRLSGTILSREVTEPEGWGVPRDDHLTGSVLLAIECPCCGGYTERLLAWLSTATSLPCGDCGSHVDVGGGEARHLIDTFVTLDKRLDEEFAG